MVQKLRGLCLVLILVCVCFVAVPSRRVFADVITIPNDGSATDVPYGDYGLKNSYGDVNYYDCYIPYSLSIKDVGGWARSYYNCYKTAYRYSMSDYPRRLEYKIGSSTMTREGDKSTGSRYHGTTVSEDELGMDVFTDSNGNQYYASALPFFFYNFGGLSMESGADFPDWGLSSNGQAFDMILTDGTCIHFIVADHKSISHTNWGDDGVSPENGDVQYTFDPIIYPQYANIFQAANGETFEIWGNVGCVANFMSAYGISATGNRVAVIRMYDIDLDSDAPVRDPSVGTSVSYKMADSVSVTTVDGSLITGSSSLSVTGSTLVEEWALVGMPNRSDLSDMQSIISLPTRENLGVEESSVVAQLGSNIEIIRQADMFDTLRVALTFSGLVFILYGIFILLAIIFDKVNTFIDISMVSLLTFGKLHFDPWEDSDTKGNTGVGRVVVMASVVIVFGMLLVSGGLTRVIGQVVYWIFSKAV